MKVVTVAAFLMCDGSEFQTEGPKREKPLSPLVFQSQSGSFRRRVSATGAKKEIDESTPER